ncbi:MAG: NADH-quinone oxidoreductase subunit H [Thermoprotei archaeon]|nr:MAG: NADH-quinone oxidoreductase subunit H [Thermoprotei archaeon]RLF25323.1 MAG: NADH-quinone oxidoreductase subunit H [Thermoprotei archaeon]
MSVLEYLMVLVKTLIYPGVIFVIILSLIYEWVDRKVYARMQNRIGPFYVGPSGFLQPFADFLKLLSKEDIVPPHVDYHVFTLSPIITLYLVLLAMFLIPTGAWNEPYAILAFEGDYILALALTTFITIFSFFAGWSSVNRFGVIGAMRALYQMISYEISMFLCAAAVALDTRTLCLSRMAEVQASGLWYILLHPLGFVVFILSMQAELDKVPFDTPEAKTEIVGGWLTEISGKKLAFFRLASDIKLFFCASLATTLYLAGPWGPLGPNILWFLAKVTFVIILVTTLRAAFARFRIDQVLAVFWKYAIPLSLVQVLIALFIPH